GSAFPWCWFCACSSIITGDHGKADPYVRALEREMDLYLPLLQPGRLVEQMHLGGGSPDFFTPSQLERLCRAVVARFSFAPDAELSAELEPRILTQAHVDVLAAAGFTRASIGVQDSDPAVQKAVHRIQPPELNIRALDMLRESGFSSVNVDVMYGLPLQTQESFSRTIDHVVALAPDRVAVFNYAHVPWMKPAQKNLLLAGALPGGMEKIALFSIAAEKLTQAGYVHIGLDHFARPDDELAKAHAAGTMQRNFQGYSTRAGAEMLGFGVTAISQSPKSYRQNFHALDDYYKAVNAGRLPVERGVMLSEEDVLRRKVIMAVMCAALVDYAALSRLTGVDFESHFALELAGMDDLEADGLVVRRPGKLEITPAGRLLVRSIALRFDQYYKPAEKRHSKAL
ncbi:MAG TPA: oxygen-independent coproporphyrinogen III oxidase, partial [Opitutales bacterium]|nr:oxygen-independent coproporphyrinogen III oxidase [Opitutales bacterium]